MNELAPMIRSSIFLSSWCWVAACTGPNPNYCPSAHDFNCAELDARSCSPACSGRTPICSADLTCHACVAHADCPSDVCLPDGSCSDGRDVAYVDGAGAATSDCTRGAPCSTISAAIATQKPIIKVTGTVTDHVTITAGTTTILADPMAKLTGPAAGGSLITLSGGVTTIVDLELTGATGFSAFGLSLPAGSTAMVTLQRVQLDHDAFGGISLKSGSLVIQQAMITENGGPGITTTGGQLSMFRSSVTRNRSGGGVQLNAAKFDLENNVITNNTGSGVVVAAIPAGQQPARFVFNTVMANAVPSGAAGVDCSGTSSLLAFADNIVYGNATAGAVTTQISGSCTYAYSDIGPGALVAGTGNLAADPLVVGIAQDNAHLIATSPCRDAAELTAAVTVDLDGDARPQGPRSDVGADEFTP